MTWRHQALAESFIRDFAGRALPDAVDLDECRLHVVASGGGWKVDADIPTSSLSCWLAFRVSEDGFAGTATLDLAIRSGSGNDASNVYIWDDLRQAWQLSAEDPTSGEPQP